MSNHGDGKKSGKGGLIRLLAILVVGVVCVVVAMNVKSPLAISEAEVEEMLREGTLVGLSVEEAGKMLQHTAPATVDGVVVFDFDRVKGWKAKKVRVDVMGGRVTAAGWMAEGEEELDVRQDQGDGASGGALEGQGAPTGIRATNQTSGGGGPR